MKFLRILIVCSLLPITATVILLGCMWADHGTKTVGGYFGDNVVFDLSLTEDEVVLVLFNETVRIRR
ncbi:MAG: hypothetical protein IJN42_05790 [Clostridia bacterium]|nr:hypothetical protein [Clostridia bacterium]